MGRRWRGGARVGLPNRSQRAVSALRLGAQSPPSSPSPLLKRPNNESQFKEKGLRRPGGPPPHFLAHPLPRACPLCCTQSQQEMRERRAGLTAAALLAATLGVAALGSQAAAAAPVVHADAASIASHLSVKGKERLAAAATGKVRYSALTGVRHEITEAVHDDRSADAAHGRALATSARAAAPARRLAGFGKALEPVLLRDKLPLGDYGAEFITLTHGWTVELPFPAEVRQPPLLSLLALCFVCCCVCHERAGSCPQHHAPCPLVVIHSAALLLSIAYPGPRPASCLPPPPHPPCPSLFSLAERHPPWCTDCRGAGR